MQDLAAYVAALAALEKNDNAWTYTIPGFDGSPYITRTLLPRVGEHRLLLHQIHRADADPYLHNHPWRTARFLILSGGYVEERLTGGFIVERMLLPGDWNEIDADTFHRVREVLPNTWTLGIVGERCQDWGFLVDGVLIPSAEYFAMRGYQPNAPGIS
jgi:hypothetical protein